MPCLTFIAKDTPKFHGVRWNQVVGTPAGVTGLSEAEGVCEACEMEFTVHGVIAGDERLVCPGDWVVTPDGGGQAVSYNQADFEALYEAR